MTEIFPLDDPVLRKELSKMWAVRNALSFMQDQCEAGLLACIHLKEDRELMIRLNIRFRSAERGVGILFFGLGDDTLFVWSDEDPLTRYRPSPALRRAIARVFLED